jgi:hypothetical protein
LALLLAIGGRDSRSPSIDDLASAAIGDPNQRDELVVHTAIGSSGIKIEAMTSDDIDGTAVTGGRRGSIGSGSLDMAMIQPYRNNPHRLDPNSDEAHGIVDDHERNPCRCCCGIFLSLPNLVLTIMVMYYSLATWRYCTTNAHPHNHTSLLNVRMCSTIVLSTSVSGPYEFGVGPWYMATHSSIKGDATSISSSSTSVKLDSNCHASLTWNAATPMNHTDSFTITPCAVVKKTAIYLGFAMTFAILYPIITIVIAIMKHRMKTMHRLLSLLACLFITGWCTHNDTLCLPHCLHHIHRQWRLYVIIVLFCKLAIDTWSGTKGVQVASNMNKLQMWSTINEGGEGDAVRRCSLLFILSQSFA